MRAQNIFINNDFSKAKKRLDRVKERLALMVEKK